MPIRIDSTVFYAKGARCGGEPALPQKHLLLCLFFTAW
jgi:hypothetical protein